MSRIRTIKPSFFLHHGLFLTEQRTGLPVRLAFAGLWTCCDREGRFKWRPMELKVQILPYDTADFATILDALEADGYLVKYQHNNEWYGSVTTWTKHQAIPTREPSSVLPNPPENGESQQSIAFAMPEHVTVRAEGKGREGERNGRSEVPNGTSCAESSSTPQRSSLATLPLNDGSSHETPIADEIEMEQLYPGVDLVQSFRNMRGWCLSNPQRLKTKSGIKRFINTWLAKDQDNARPSTGGFINGNGQKRITRTDENVAAMERAQQIRRDLAARQHTS